MECDEQSILFLKESLGNPSLQLTLFAILEIDLTYEFQDSGVLILRRATENRKVSGTNCISTLAAGLWTVTGMHHLFCSPSVSSILGS